MSTNPADVKLTYKAEKEKKKEKGGGGRGGGAGGRKRKKKKKKRGGEGLRGGGVERKKLPYYEEIAHCVTFTSAVFGKNPFLETQMLEEYVFVFG